MRTRNLSLWKEEKMHPKEKKKKDFYKDKLWRRLGKKGDKEWSDKFLK